VRLIELEVGSWFWSPRWSENAAAVVVDENPVPGLGVVLIHVHNRHPDWRRPSTLRPRLTSLEEMERDDWQRVARPDWLSEVGGSGGTPR
jgi:hypothetical protein